MAGDLRLMLDGAKLQIRESEVELARLTKLLREAKNKTEEIPKKRTIDYQRALSGSDSSSSSDDLSSRQRSKKASKKSKHHMAVCAN